ncbi:MAG TPA: 1-phosphofructokinase family hexose kinase [Armatimonadota bacterium]|nr:1-phosphofructokinase family hexose kinase [Armatimonadota bacterium]
MILSVTPNTGLDRVLFLPELRRNRRNQAEAVEAMGGKGCDVSLILREWGIETVATGLAAGETGRKMEAMLRRAGVVADFVWTEGETRTNTVLIETASGAHTTVCAAGLRPDGQALPALLGWVERWAPSAEAVVLAGSLPESWPSSVYADLVRAARGADRPVPVIVDASGPALEAALAAGVDAIKPNRDELETVCGPAPGPGALLAAARALRERGAGRVLVSLGPEGALLVCGNGAWRAEGLRVPVVNPAGAGDGMTACLALGAARGWNEAETLRWAVAVSAAIVTTRGTAEIRRADAERLLPEVRVERVS